MYDEARSEEKRYAHRGVMQQLSRSVTRSPRNRNPHVVWKLGVPDGIWTRVTAVKALGPIISYWNYATRMATWSGFS